MDCCALCCSLMPTNHLHNCTTYLRRVAANDVECCWFSESASFFFQPPSLHWSLTQSFTQPVSCFLVKTQRHMARLRVAAAACQLRRIACASVRCLTTTEWWRLDELAVPSTLLTTLTTTVLHWLAAKNDELNKAKLAQSEILFFLLSKLVTHTLTLQSTAYRGRKGNVAKLNESWLFGHFFLIRRWWQWQWTHNHWKHKWWWWYDKWQCLCAFV